MANATKRASQFKLFCMSRGYTAQGLSDTVKQTTGETLTKSTIYAYFQGQRTPTKKSMDLLVKVLGVEVLTCFYEVE